MILSIAATLAGEGSPPTGVLTGPGPQDALDDVAPSRGLKPARPGLLLDLHPGAADLLRTFCLILLGAACFYRVPVRKERKRTGPNLRG